VLKIFSVSIKAALRKISLSASKLKVETIIPAMFQKCTKPFSKMMT
jgi:hypothetical protein